MNKKRGSTTNRINVNRMDRTVVLADLHDMLSEMHRKFTTGRMRDKQAADLQLRTLKAFAYGISIFSNVLDAVENEEIIRRLDAIEGKKDAKNTPGRGAKQP